MKVRPTSHFVYPLHGREPIGVVICLPSARAIRDEDENIVRRWADRVVNQKNTVAMRPERIA